MEDLKKRVEEWFSDYRSGAKANARLCDETNVLIKSLICKAEFIASLATPDDYTKECNRLYAKQIKELTEREAALVAALERIIRHHADHDPTPKEMLVILESLGINTNGDA